MTGNSNREDSESRQPKPPARPSSTTPSEPLQLELFERWLGAGGWTQEEPRESKPSRDFVLPPAPDAAAEEKPTNTSRTSVKPPSDSAPREGEVK
jgi:hypothetical protein